MSRDTNTVDRRRFLQQAGVASVATGALWAAPTVLGSSSAFASGSPSTCPENSTLVFVPGAPNGPDGWATGDGNGISPNAANNNGWVFSQAGLTGSDALGVFVGYHAPPVPQFVVERNPLNTGTQNNPNVSGTLVTYTHTLGTLSDERTYTFSSQIYSVDLNYYPQLLDVQILDEFGNLVTNLGRYRTDVTPANNATHVLLTNGQWNPHSWNFTPPTVGTYQFRFRFTFVIFANGGSNNNPPSTRVGDDIAVTAPTVSCSP